MSAHCQSQHLARYSHHVLEMDLLLSFRLRGGVGKQRLHPNHEIIGTTFREVPHKLTLVEGKPSIGATEIMVSQRLPEGLVNLPVGEVKGILLRITVIAFQGEITGLIKKRHNIHFIVGDIA